MKTKRFDCVKMKHLGAEKVREQIAGMTREEEIKFWKERTQYLRKHQKAVTKGQSKPAA